jgi:hypothetical protein
MLEWSCWRFELWELTEAQAVPTSNPVQARLARNHDRASDVGQPLVYLSAHSEITTHTGLDQSPTSPSVFAALRQIGKSA